MDIKNLDINVSKEIGVDITADMFFSVMDSVMEGEVLNVNIDSYGGSVFTAISIYDRVRSMPNSRGVKTIGYIHGMAGSAATTIACACDKVYIGENSFYFIHMPFFDGKDTTNEKEKGELNKIADTLINIYQKKTGLGRSVLKSMMQKETLMNAKEAKALGFVDGIIKEKKRVLNNAYSDKIKNLITQKESNMTFKERSLALLESILSIKNEAPQPKNMAVELADGKTVYVATEAEAVAVGDMVYLDEGMLELAPDGEHELTDGSKVVTAGGVIAEIVPAEVMNEADKDKDEDIMNALEQLTNVVKDQSERLVALENKLVVTATNEAEKETQIKNLETELQRVKAQRVPAKPAPSAPSADPAKVDAVAERMKSRLKAKELI